MSSEERLQKIIARAGLGSRRGSEELITSGRVRLNGKVVSELGTKADPWKDKIEVDGKRLVAEDPVYVAFHKPRNVVSTMSDPEGRPTVADHLKAIEGRVYPVGRLDFATSGLLLCTNDGEFANGLLHPKRDVPKMYVVKVHGQMAPPDLERWRQGVELEDGRTLPAEVRFLRHEGDKTWFEVTLREGRNQQIRRMGDATGFRVMRLARLSFADVTSEGLRPGDWRYLDRKELIVLRELYGVPKRIRNPPPLPAKPVAAPRAPGKPRGGRFDAATPARPDTTAKSGPRSRTPARTPEVDPRTAARSTSRTRKWGQTDSRAQPDDDGRSRAPSKPTSKSTSRPEPTSRSRSAGAGPKAARDFKSGRSGRSGTKPRGAD